MRDRTNSERGGDTQTDIQAGRQADRQTDRQANRQTDRIRSRLYGVWDGEEGAEEVEKESQVSLIPFTSSTWLLLSLLAPSPLSWAPTAVTWTTVRPSQMSLSPSGRSARFSSAPHAYCVSALSDSSPWSRSSSVLLYVHRDHKDYSGLRAQDGLLDFHTQLLSSATLVTTLSTL